MCWCLVSLGMMLITWVRIYLVYLVIMYRQPVKVSIVVLQGTLVICTIIIIGLIPHLELDVE